MLRVCGAIWRQVRTKERAKGRLAGIARERLATSSNICLPDTIAATYIMYKTRGIMPEHLTFSHDDNDDDDDEWATEAIHK